MISGSEGTLGDAGLDEDSGGRDGAVTVLTCDDVVVIASELFDLPAGVLITLSA
jgi:hypothetical protein